MTLSIHIYNTLNNLKSYFLTVKKVIILCYKQEIKMYFEIDKYDLS